MKSSPARAATPSAPWTRAGELHFGALAGASPPYSRPSLAAGTDPFVIRPCDRRTPMLCHARRGCACDGASTKRIVGSNTVHGGDDTSSSQINVQTIRRRGFFEASLRCPKCVSKKRPLETTCRRGPMKHPWRTVGPDIPCQVASQQSLTPFLQAPPEYPTPIFIQSKRHHLVDQPQRFRDRVGQASRASATHAGPTSCGRAAPNSAWVIARG